jgi:Replication protein A C terminal
MRSVLIENFVDLLCGAKACPPAGDGGVDTPATSPASHWRGARQLRASTRSMLASHRSTRRAAAQAIRHALHAHRAAVIASLRRRPRVELWANSTERQPEPVEDALRSQVLNSIQSHGEGVAAIDIANELGVDWRRVHGAAQELAAEGAIEQVEQDLYPSRKGSRK